MMSRLMLNLHATAHIGIFTETGDSRRTAYEDEPLVFTTQMPGNGDTPLASPASEGGNHGMVDGIELQEISNTGQIAEERRTLTLGGGV